MWRIARSILTVVAVCLAVIGSTACGGGGIPGDVVAQVGETAITRAELDHWMSTLTGGDFYEVARGHAVPAQLVSEPANYAACVASLQAAAASASAEQPKPRNAAPKETAARLLIKCRQLYMALRLQAMAYLVNAQWTIGVYADEGVKATDVEVRQALEAVKAAEFPKPGQFGRYLASTKRSLADELLVLKLDVLSQKLQREMRTKSSKQVVRSLSEVGQRWTAKTNCRPGYVVPHCRQFRKWMLSAPDPAVLLEQVATITGLPCVNREACG